MSGAGFAFFCQQRFNPDWVILVANYGAFLFHGSEAEAEEMRAHKANWEHQIAHKRPASVSDLEKPSGCWNHRGFARMSFFRKKPYQPRFYCECGECAHGFK